MFIWEIKLKVTQVHLLSVKSVQIRCYFWSVFSRIRTEYGVSLRIEAEFGKIQTRNNSVFGNISRSASSSQTRIQSGKQSLKIWADSWSTQISGVQYSKIWYMNVTWPLQKEYPPEIYSWDFPKRHCWKLLEIFYHQFRFQ